MSTEDFLNRCFAVSITVFALCLSALTITGIYATWQTFDIPATRHLQTIHPYRHPHL